VRIFVESTAGEVHGDFGSTGYELLGAIARALLAERALRDLEAEYERHVDRFSVVTAVHESMRRVFEHELAAEYNDLVARMRSSCPLPGLDAARALLWESLAIEHSHSQEHLFRVVIDQPAVARVLRYARAKALEDTYNYRDIRVLARNELGIDPNPQVARRDSLAVLEEAMRARTESAGESLTPTSTHDTKRSEDARARCAVIARHAREFAALVCSTTESFKAQDASEFLRADAWFILQEAIAIWPSRPNPEQLCGVVERLESHVVKYAREAKLRSTWAAPDRVYEERLQAFVRHCIDPYFSERPTNPEWRIALHRFAGDVVRESAPLSLAQIALKCVAPGIPDFYQGCEYVRPMLVDPDNRSPVDFSARVAAMHSLDRDGRLPLSKRVARAIEADDCDRIKLLVTRELLRFRSERAEFLQRAAVAMHPFRFVYRVDSPAAFVLRRFDETREISVVVPLVGMRDLAEARAVKLPRSKFLARTDWFTGRVFDAESEFSMREIVEPLGFALLVGE
jgi:maltooligosyltrehalose synthase